MTAVLNEPSQAVMRRLGLTEVGRFSHPGGPRAAAVRDLPPVTVTDVVVGLTSWTYRALIWTAARDPT